MSNTLLLKRTAPVFPELSKGKTALDCFLPRPRKRSRVVESCSCPSGLSSDDWLDLESMLNDDFEIESRLPSLKDCIPKDITMSVSDALSEMIRACNEDDELGSSVMPSTSTSSSTLVSSDHHSIVSIADNDTNNVSRAHTRQEKIPTGTTCDLVTQQAGSAATLLTLTSFPFRIFSADKSFFGLTGLTSSRVIGEPLSTLFATKRPKLTLHTVDSPLEIFDGTLVNVSNDELSASGTSTRTINIEPVWSRSEEVQTSHVSHYKVTLQ